jgi:hypothetical protein
MKLYKILCHGRRIGAIGITGPVYKEVRAENKEAAQLALYKYYEHITNLTIKEVPK